MDAALFKRAIDTLLLEAYKGPPHPEMTWFASNVPASGVLGTLADINAADAAAKPTGFSHSIAEHAAHLRFALDVALQYAQGNMHQPDWEKSWETGPLDQAGWSALRQSLEASYERLRSWSALNENFTQFELVCGLCAQAAHGAYHLAMIRQLAGYLQRTTR